MTINYKQIISFLGLATCLILAILSIPAKWLILSIICEICIVLIFDPYKIFWRWFPPVSIALMVSSIILVTFACYTHINAWAIFIPVLVAMLMIAGIIRFNKEWLSKYRFNASQSVKTALVSDEETEYNEAWYSYGRRECDTLMREYLYKAVSITDLECVYRHIYALGYIDATNARLDDLNALEGKIEGLEGDLNDIGRNTVPLTTYNTLLDEIQTANDDLDFWRDYCDAQNAQYDVLKREYDLLIAAEQEEDEEIYNDNIIELPSINEQIIRDRNENNLSYNELAEKYNKTKSQIQYILKKGATA